MFLRIIQTVACTVALVIDTNISLITKSNAPATHESNMTRPLSVMEAYVLSFALGWAYRPNIISASYLPFFFFVRALVMAFPRGSWSPVSNLRGFGRGKIDLLVRELHSIDICVIPLPTSRLMLLVVSVESRGSRVVMEFTTA